MEWFSAAAAALTGAAALLGVWTTLTRDREALRRVERVVDLVTKVEDAQARTQLLGLRDVLISRYVDSLLSDRVKSRKALIWGVGVYFAAVAVWLASSFVSSPYKWIASTIALGLLIWSAAACLRSFYFHRRHLKTEEQKNVEDARASLEGALAERARITELAFARRVAGHLADESGTSRDSGEASPVD